MISFNKVSNTFIAIILLEISVAIFASGILFEKAAAYKVQDNCWTYITVNVEKLEPFYRHKISNDSALEHAQAFTALRHYRCLIDKR